MSNVYVRSAGGIEQIIEITIPSLTKESLIETMELIPKAIAEQYVKDHMQEIMDKLSLNEIATQIAAAIGQQVAAQMKSKKL